MKTGTTKLINGQMMFVEDVEKPQRKTYLVDHGEILDDDIYNMEQYQKAMREYQQAIEPKKIVNEHNVVRCWKCGEIVLITEGGLPIMCVMPMPIRFSGICAGSYEKYKLPDNSKVQAKETDQGIVITKIL